MQTPKPTVDPRKVVIDAEVRFDPQTVLDHFKLKVPSKITHPSGVFMHNFGFAVLMYKPKPGHSVHFLCKLPDWPRLVEGLKAYVEACKVPVVNEMNLATVTFKASDHCEEFANTADRLGLEGSSWDVFSNRFNTYHL